jgi:hypothetical protein
MSGVMMFGAGATGNTYRADANDNTLKYDVYAFIMLS